jgi:hypothetical protein
LFLLLGLVACSTDPDAGYDKVIAKLRKQTPQVTGGFTYKQFVVANPGDPEVLGDEGVLYISPTMFTDEQLKHIGETQSGKEALEIASSSLANGLLNMCFSAQSRNDGKAGSGGDYSRLVITWAHKVKDQIEFELYAWPDAWYDWSLMKSRNQVIAKDPGTQHDFGWQSTRIVLTPDSSVDLNKCLSYRKTS